MTIEVSAFRSVALDAYVHRCEARPAFQKALADQMAPFATHAPAAP